MILLGSSIWPFLVAALANMVAKGELMLLELLRMAVGFVSPSLLLMNERLWTISASAIIFHLC